MFTDFLLKLTFYAQPEKLPASSLDQTRSNYSDKLTQLDVKQRKMISGLAAKHRKTAEIKLKLIRIIFLHEG